MEHEYLAGKVRLMNEESRTGDSNGSVAIVGCILVDVVGGQRIPDTTVILQGDRIAAVGPPSEVQAPAGAKLVDARGTWVIPGLVDMHVHVSGFWSETDMLPVYLAAGVTTVRDVGGNITELRLMRDALEAGRRPGPRLFMAGNLLDGLPPLWPRGALLVDTPQRARAASRFLIEQGVDLLKVYNSVPEESLAVIVDEAHTAGLPVTGHVPRALTMTRAVEIGMDGLEHIRVTGRELLPPEEAARIDFLPLVERETLLWDRFDLESPGMHRVIALLAERGTFLDPTMIVDAGTFGPYTDERETGPLDAMLPADLAEEMQKQDMRNTPMFQLPPHLKESARAGFAKRLQFVKMCHDAGVRILAGTDTVGVGKMLPGASLHEELCLLVQAGLSPLQALRAATATAAEALQLQSDLGAVQPGKWADLVILEGDPLSDIQNVRRVRTVISRGQIYHPAELLRPE